MSKPDRKNYRLWLNQDESIDIYADEMVLTQAGDIVFYTWQDTGVKSPEGEIAYSRDVCLAHAAGNWQRFETMQHGNPLWKQSGKIKAA